ncbi:KpsF/GutQ family sugar-phosphate isomerase [Shimia marina]|uniref:Arabinose 5-phosphate isomerase KdsD n=1 Tax=Shimia marina TaxID=321267 RepID=A0A0P1EMZ0_9RHOB|nr:KpsF/GutQ family sugar-phosphate isomerase [Shimia marina]CUH51585.1 Arabinose 5-phosphate isomerase KdsD [Shimia marina]SFD45360.1 arabinose-5-phosphate isomerase [Shimia marina]
MTDADKQTFLETARRVISIEQNALGALADSLGQNIGEAVSLLLHAEGRVIVSGMGKSGHIARKIAATFASTGTPAQFVHPAEASHGDLGMVAKGDVALVLSNSGETPELADLIAHTRRFNIPLIGVASRPESTLITQSDVALILPQAEEACGTGVVPTTTTTMTLALGDALAVALMEHRRFTPENFRAFHPGGKLGAQLTLVQDLMHTGAKVPLIAENTAMPAALNEISDKGFGVVGITNANGALTGIITDGDLRRKMDGILQQTTDQVMTADPMTIAPGAMAEEAVGIMNQRQITCLFVVDAEQGGKPVGLLHIHDCLRAGLG